MPKLIVKPDNIYPFEVELNDSFKLGALPEDEQKAIMEKNAAFEQEQIQQALLNHAAPCNCRMPIIQERMMTRIRLMPTPPPPGTPIQMELLQEDVDARTFGIVIGSTNGVYTSIDAIVVGCKACGAVQIFGGVEGLTRAIAEGHTAALTYNQIMNAATDGEAAGDGEFMMENLDTGERSECDDLGKALFGHSDDGVSLSSADGDKVVPFPGAESEGEN